MTRLKMWQSNWEEAELEWDKQAAQAAKTHPIKKLQVIPEMIGMTPDTAKNLKWKSLKWMVTQDHKKEIFWGVLKHPFKYGWELIKSALNRHPYKAREGDFFLYGVHSVEEFSSRLKDTNTLLVLGFSYCHKPFECPSGRFTAECIHDANHPVCQQCFIGKAVNAITPENTISLFIPTIHYIGGKILEIVHAHPDKKVLFMITACEMTLEMFGDWGNMVNIQGLGIRLGGRICNTMKAFELSERGVKPGLTVVLDQTQQKMMELIRQRNFKDN